MVYKTWNFFNSVNVGSRLRHLEVVFNIGNMGGRLRHLEVFLTLEILVVDWDTWKFFKIGNIGGRLRHLEVF